MSLNNQQALRTLELPGIPKVASGKVREMFDLGDFLLMVASDRISAFDVILPNPIPNKGKVLTQMSKFWFEGIDARRLVAHHLITTDPRDFPHELAPFGDRW